jgi:thiamine-monophosphate kinase
MRFIHDLYRGLTAASGPYDCPIVGGDTGAWNGKLVMSVTILGRSAGIAPIRRSGARPGDGIFVTGALGGSLLGRHMTFSPRVNEARALAGAGLITSMIDLSDGLSRDLAHLCEESHCGAIVEDASIPIHADARELSSRDGRPAIDHAWHDGEDYELLFTAPAQPVCQVPIHRIGVVTEEAAVLRKQADGAIAPVARAGWEHQV